MNPRKKTAVIASCVLIALVGIYYITHYLGNNAALEQLPALPDLSSYSSPIQEQLTQAQQKVLDDPSAENIGQLGMAYHTNVFYEQAAKCYEVALKKNPKQWIWNYYLGYLYQEMGDSKGAIDNFNAVIRQNPEILHAMYYLGSAYLNLNEGAKAEEMFKNIAQATKLPSYSKSIRTTYTPLPIAAKFELARMYISSKRVDEAEKLLLGIIEKTHTVGPVYRLLGDVYREKGDLELSQKYILRASDLPQVTTINDTLADRLSLISRSTQYLPKQIEEAMKSANPEWATRLFDQALKYTPEDKYVVSKYIKHLLRMERGKNAFAYLQKHFDDFKNDYKEMAAMGDQLFTYSFYAQALPYFVQAEKLQPGNIDVQANLAYCYWKTGDKQSALNVMDALYEKNKGKVDVLAKEVDFMFKAGQKDKAGSYLTTFKQLAPSHPKLLKLEGMVCEMEGKREAAIPLYEAAFKGDPKDIEVTSKLGNILIEKRDWGRAISLLRTSMQYNPNESILLERLGTLLISCPDPKLQNIPEGLELSERAFYHVSSNMATLLSAGKNFALGNAMIGDFDKASYYMRLTLNIAKSEKVPQDYMNVLLQLDSEIKKASKN